ncbi:hypothetical protein PIROE2DRAFT_14444, partial [Piromyces sp. E2]
VDDGNNNNNNNNNSVDDEENNQLLSQKHGIFNETFENYFYLIIKDIDYILQYKYIEKSIPKLLNFEELNKNNLNNCPEIIWRLFIEFGYLTFESTNDKNNKIFDKGKLKMRNEIIEEFNKIELLNWKSDLYKKYKDIIDLFINNYDEEKIKESLESLFKINNNCSKNEIFNNWYSLIYSLLSLNNQYIIVKKDNFNEENNIYELLYVDKEYLYKLNNNSFNNNKPNFNNDNKNYKNKNNQSNDSSDSSKIFYITIKNVNERDKFEEGCIKALDNNEDFEFNGVKLKEKYDKIIKFGMAVYENKCDVIYEINYRNNFERKKMPRIPYRGENFGELCDIEHFFIDKTRMISKIINEKRGVYLITRPRRFGKSLNLKMIREFFEKYNNENVKRNVLFDGLEVSKDRKNMREYHKYPVIFLNFKNNSSNNYESAIEFIKDKISELYKEHKNKIKFEKLSEQEQSEWNKIENQEENETDLKNSLYYLTKILKNFIKEKVLF